MKNGNAGGITRWTKMLKEDIPVSPLDVELHSTGLLFPVRPFPVRRGSTDHSQNYVSQNWPNCREECRLIGWTVEQKKHQSLAVKCKKTWLNLSQGYSRVWLWIARELGEIWIKDTAESGCEVQGNLVKFESRILQSLAVNCKGTWWNLSQGYSRVWRWNARKLGEIWAKDTPESGCEMQENVVKF